MSISNVQTMKMFKRMFKFFKRANLSCSNVNFSNNILVKIPV